MRIENDLACQVILTGNVKIETVNFATNERKSQTVKNLVVTAGRNLIRDLLTENTDAGLTHFAVGTGSTAAAAGDTALGGEVQRGSITKQATSAGQFIIYYYLPSTAANGSTLTEAGIFNASSGGTMFCRTTYAGIAKTSSIAVYYTWTINIGAS